MHGPRIAEAYINTLKYQVFPIRRIFNAGTPEVRCDCSDETCASVAKHPRIPWSKEVGVPSMWEKWPYDGFGIATGKRSSIWVLDVDPRAGGVETLAALEQKYSPLPKTISVITGSRGLHFYFAFPGENYRNTAGTLGAGLDTRGDGGYVVGPGSLHKSGRRYNWQVGPADAELAVAPSWLLELVKQPPRPTFVGGSGLLEPKQGIHSAGTPRKEAEFLLEEMLSPECRLASWMRDYPDEVSREVWRGMATNLACAVLDHPDLIEKACAEFHKLSEEYDGYKPGETERTFRDAIVTAATYGPVSFEHMVRSGLPAEYVYPATARNLLHYARLEWRQRDPRER